VSLDAVRKHFNIPAKSTPYNLFQGKQWNEIDPDARHLIAEGACDEVESIWNIFCNFMHSGFPREELYVIDVTIRMFTEPVLRADIPLLAKVWQDENTRKQERLAELNVTKEQLQSDNKFAELLKAEGVEPPTKISPKTGKDAWAFAKTDQGMRDLLECDDERLRTLAEARIGQKSTFLQTRAETLGFMARRGAMPVYLSYCGAHTTRWSGGDKCNWQNFKRGSDIRKAILPPEGFYFGIIDLAQIEYRILCWLAGEEEALQELRDGGDPYVELASEVYGFRVTKDHMAERGTGKQLKLSCGYQAGAATIQRTARLGIYGPPVKISIEEAERWKNIYRQRMVKTVQYWREAGRMIARIAGGEPVQWGPGWIKDGKLYGPNNCALQYPNIEYHVDNETGDRFWRYRNRHGWTKLYSGKLVENYVQFLARIVLSQAMIRISRLGYRVVNTTHDELLLLIPKDGKEQQHLEICEAEMRREPEWLSGIPLDVESSLAERYSK
jgi:DNA polymerase